MPADGMPASYVSYLLRVWRVQEQDRPTCRALLENVATGERKGFNGLSDLVAFLEAQTLKTDETEAAFVARD